MPDMLTSTDLEELLQVDRSTIYRMADSGRLPAVKVGRQWRFPRGAVERWLSSQVKAESSEGIGGETDAYRDGLDAWPIDCLELMLNAFADLLDVMLVMTDLDGEPITEVSNPQDFYRLLQETEAGADLCHDTWRELGQMPAIEPRWVITFADLLCARAFVRVGDKLEAMVIAFGVAPPGWSMPAEVETKAAEELGLDSRDLREVFGRVQPISLGHQSEVLRTLQRISDILAHIGSERSALIGRLNEIARLSSL
jgi:excisionase family DNA binding protein